MEHLKIALRMLSTMIGRYLRLGIYFVAVLAGDSNSLLTVIQLLVGTDDRLFVGDHWSGAGLHLQYSNCEIFEGP